MTDHLRALTVKQPWADAIIDGHKPVENRSAGFPMGYRGVLLIHAGKAWSDRGAHDPRMLAAYPDEGHLSRGHTMRHAGPRGRYPFAFGMVIGSVEVVDIHPALDCCAPWGEGSYEETGGKVVTNVTHLILERPVRWQRPIAMRGALGLWRPNHSAVDTALAEEDR